jgi:hypothetical protein
LNLPKRIQTRVFASVFLTLVFSSPARSDSDYRWLKGQEPRDALERRFAPPPGYRRIPAPAGSFAGWLRRLPLKKGTPPVRLHNGNLKTNQTAHRAVVDIDVGDPDLQQCADAVIRLRAEYLWARGRAEDICFRYTSGEKSPWLRWAAGERPLVFGQRVKWIRRKPADASGDNFRAYLTATFRWAGSASLSRELVPVADPSKTEIGDVFIRGGFPGHAVLVADLAENAKGERVFLLVQSYMPAQEIHVLGNPRSAMDPWYAAEDPGPLKTPEWTFERNELKRFSETGCP